jgi:hypothetical protein
MILSKNLLAVKAIAGLHQKDILNFFTFIIVHLSVINLLPTSEFDSNFEKLQHFLLTLISNTIQLLY